MRRLACALVLAGLLAACGGGGSDGASGSSGTKATEPAKAPTAANYVDALVKASEGNGLGDDPNMNRCFAQSYVETVGAKALAAKISVDKLASQTGMTVDTLGIMLTPAQRDAFYQRLKGCSDPKTYFVDIFSKGNSLDAKDKACLSGVLDDRILETMLVAAFDGDTTPVEGTQGMTTAFQRIGAACPHILQAGGLAQ